MTEIYQGKTTHEYLQFYKDRPQEILIETVGACNLRCIGCPQSLNEYRQAKTVLPFMGMNLLENILWQVNELWKPINVGLYHTGEITLMPDKRFAETLDMAKHYLPDSEGWDSVGFYTNGMMLTEEKQKAIINAGINWVRLSFDGGTKQAYEKVRIGGHFETVVWNAKEFAKRVALSGAKIRLEVILVPYRENETTLGEFKRIWNASGWKASAGGAMNYGGIMQEAVEPRRHALQNVVRARHSIPCPRIFEQFSVLVDGTVSLCSADPMGKFILGDLKTQKISEIWMGEKHLNIIAKHLETGSVKPSPCDVCDYTQYCGTPQGEYFGEHHE